VLSQKAFFYELSHAVYVGPNTLGVPMNAFHRKLLCFPNLMLVETDNDLRYLQTFVFSCSSIAFVCACHVIFAWYFSFCKAFSFH